MNKKSKVNDKNIDILCTSKNFIYCILLCIFFLILINVISFNSMFLQNYSNIVYLVGKFEEKDFFILSDDAIKIINQIPDGTLNNSPLYIDTVYQINIKANDNPGNIIQKITKIDYIKSYENTRPKFLNRHLVPHTKLFSMSEYIDFVSQNKRFNWLLKNKSELYPIYTRSSSINFRDVISFINTELWLKHILKNPTDVDKSFDEILALSRDFDNTLAPTTNAFSNHPYIQALIQDKDNFDRVYFLNEMGYMGNVEFLNSKYPIYRTQEMLEFNREVISNTQIRDELLFNIRVDLEALLKVWESASNTINWLFAGVNKQDIFDILHNYPLLQDILQNCSKPSDFLQTQEFLQWKKNYCGDSDPTYHESDLVNRLDYSALNALYNAYRTFFATNPYLINDIDGQIYYLLKFKLDFDRKIIMPFMGINYDNIQANLDDGWYIRCFFDYFYGINRRFNYGFSKEECFNLSKFVYLNYLKFESNLEFMLNKEYLYTDYYNSFCHDLIVIINNQTFKMDITPDILISIKNLGEIYLNVKTNSLNTDIFIPQLEGKGLKEYLHEQANLIETIYNSNCERNQYCTNKWTFLFDNDNKISVDSFSNIKSVYNNSFKFDNFFENYRDYGDLLNVIEISSNCSKYSWNFEKHIFSDTFAEFNFDSNQMFYLNNNFNDYAFFFKILNEGHKPFTDLLEFHQYIKWQDKLFYQNLNNMVDMFKLILQNNNTVVMHMDKQYAEKIKPLMFLQDIYNNPTLIKNSRAYTESIDIYNEDKEVLKELKFLIVVTNDFIKNNFFINNFFNLSHGSYLEYITTDMDKSNLISLLKKNNS